MADLNMEDALLLAGQLTTVGHPMAQTALMATAMDLIGWCKGGISDNRPWTPYEQANVVVQEARMTFGRDGGNWTRAGGTTALLSIFRKNFDPAKLGRERQPIDADATPEQKAAWRVLYGEADPVFSQKILRALTKSEYAEDRKAVLWEAVRNAIYYTETAAGRADLSRIDDKDTRINSFKYWRNAAARNSRDYPDAVAGFRVELEQYGWDALMEFDWLKAKGASA